MKKCEVKKKVYCGHCEKKLNSVTDPEIRRSVLEVRKSRQVGGTVVHCEKRISEREPKAYGKSALSRTVRPLGSEPFRTESGWEEVLDGNRNYRVLDKKGRSY